MGFSNLTVTLGQGGEGGFLEGEGNGKGEEEEGEGDGGKSQVTIRKRENKTWSVTFTVYLYFGKKTYLRPYRFFQLHVVDKIT